MQIKKISALLDIMENHKNYRPSTFEKYKLILRLFYKVVYGNNKFYSEQINWFSIKLSKDRSREFFTLDMTRAKMRLGILSFLHRLQTPIHNIQMYPRMLKF